MDIRIIRKTYQLFNTTKLLTAAWNRKRKTALSAHCTIYRKYS